MREKVPSFLSHFSYPVLVQALHFRPETSCYVPTLPFFLRQQQLFGPAAPARDKHAKSAGQKALKRPFRENACSGAFELAESPKLGPLQKLAAPIFTQKDEMMCWRAH